MGSPLAPVSANLFMGHHEKICLKNYKVSRILLYRRYVVNTFCLIDSEHDAILFFLLYQLHAPEYTFRYGERDRPQVPFVDVLVDNNGSQFLITSVYCKKTLTGLLTNCCSFTPL